MIAAWWLLLGALSLSSCQALAPPLTLALDAKRAEKSKAAEEVSHALGPAFKYPLELTQAGMSKGFIISPTASEQDKTKSIHGTGDSSKHQRNILLRFGRSCDQLALGKGCSNKRSSVHGNSALPLNEYQASGTGLVSRLNQQSVRHSRHPRGSTRGPVSGAATLENLRKTVPGTFINERTVPLKTTRKTDTKYFKSAGETGTGALETPGKTSNRVPKTAVEILTQNYDFDSMVVGHVGGSGTNFPTLGNGKGLSRLGKRIMGISLSPRNDQNKDSFNSQSEKMDQLNFIRFG